MKEQGSIFSSFNKFDKKNYWLILLYIAFVIFAMPFAIVSAIWPDIAKNIHTLEVNLSIVSGVYLVINVIFLTLASFIITKIGARATIGIGILLHALSLFLFPFATNLSFCILSAVVMAIGTGLIDTATNYYFSVCYEAKHVVWLHGFWGLGSFLGPFIMAKMLTGGLSYRQGLLILVPIFVIVSALIIISIRVENSVEEKSSVKGQNKFTYREIFTTKNAILFFVCMFLGDLLLNAVGVWYSTYVVEAFDINSIVAANMLAMYFGALTISRMLSGFAVDKFGIEKVVVFGLIIFVIISIPLVINLHKVCCLYIVAIFLGAGIAPVYPLVMNYSKKVFDERILQGVIGVAGSFAQLGSFTSTCLIGILTYIFSIKCFSYVLLFFGIISILVFLRLTRNNS